jgi:hypothetical protein
MDTQQILQQVQSENEARVADMSSIERETAIQELQEMFGSDLLERLKLRAEKKKAVVITEGIPASNPAIPKDDGTVTAQEAENGAQVPAVAFDIPSQDKGDQHPFSIFRKIYAYLGLFTTQVKAKSVSPLLATYQTPPMTPYPLELSMTATSQISRYTYQD